MVLGASQTPGLARSLLPATPAPTMPEAWSRLSTKVACVLQVRPRPGCDSAAVAAVLVSYPALY